MTPSAFANSGPVFVPNTTATNATNWAYVPIYAPPAPVVRSLPKCRRCGNRTVPKEFMDCNVCKGRGRR